VKVPADRSAQVDASIFGHSFDRLAARLSALPDNHPSSARYATDGPAGALEVQDAASEADAAQRRDSPTRVRPLDDAEFRAHIDDVAAGLEAAKERGLETKSLYTVDSERKVWDFGRIEKQNEIIDHL
jgi:hypothetical protein